jgi:hypothetical protein
LFLIHDQITDFPWDHNDIGSVLRVAFCSPQFRPILIVSRKRIIVQVFFSGFRLSQSLSSRNPDPSFRTSRKPSLSTENFAHFFLEPKTFM